MNSTLWVRLIGLMLIWIQSDLPPQPPGTTKYQGGIYKIQSTYLLSLLYLSSIMIGFSIEFKPWYITVRGPRGRVYLATGFSKHVPVFTPRRTYLDSEYSTFISNTTDYMSEHYDELEEERQYGIYK